MHFFPPKQESVDVDRETDREETDPEKDKGKNKGKDSEKGRKDGDMDASTSASDATSDTYTFTPSSPDPINTDEIVSDSSGYTYTYDYTGDKTKPTVTTPLPGMQLNGFMSTFLILHFAIGTIARP